MATLKQAEKTYCKFKHTVANSDGYLHTNVLSVKFHVDLTSNNVWSLLLKTAQAFYLCHRISRKINK